MNRVVLYKIVDGAYKYRSVSPKEAMVLCLKGEWQQVLSKPLASYYYACNVIRGRWPEGEAVLVTNPYSAFYYAKLVIKGRWPEAESVIATNPGHASAYARDVIKGRWPEGEAMIASDPYSAFYYARDVIKGRWLEAEDTIKQSGPHWKLYAKEHGLATKESVV